MLERVKIKLREQDVEFYAYGDDYPPPYLYWKSRFLNEEDPSYPDQLAFDEALDGLGLFDLSGFGPTPGGGAGRDAAPASLEDRRLHPEARVAGSPPWTTPAVGS
jgi:hypothetical protein